MGVSLNEFASRFAFQRGLIRVNKGPSIVPLLIVHFTNDSLYSAHNPGNATLLVNVCQRTGTLTWHRDLTRWYSSGTSNWYSRDWFDGIDVVEIRPPSVVKTNRILHIYAQVNRIYTDDVF